MTPADRALSVANTDDQYSAGIPSRCHHFVTMPAETPISVAMAKRAPCASLGPQSSIIDWNEVRSVMTYVLGPFVLKCKPKASLDCGRPLGHNVRMAEYETEAQYKQRFIERVAASRIATGLKQWQIAEALGIPQDKYKQYEKRSLMPHHMIGRFCLIARIEPEWLITGHGKKPLQPLHTAADTPAPSAKPRRIRAKRVA